jgi:hypothetical protein
MSLLGIFPPFDGLLQLFWFICFSFNGWSISTCLLRPGGSGLMLSCGFFVTTGVISYFIRLFLIVPAVELMVFLLLRSALRLDYCYLGASWLCQLRFFCYFWLWLQWGQLPFVNFLSKSAVFVLEMLYLRYEIIVSEIVQRQFWLQLRQLLVSRVVVAQFSLVEGQTAQIVTPHPLLFNIT